MLTNFEKGIMDEIFLVTEDIQTELPELYVLLSETPLFLSVRNDTISESELSAYLSSLEMQLKTFCRIGK